MVRAVAVIAALATVGAVMPQPSPKRTPRLHP